MVYKRECGKKKHDSIKKLAEKIIMLQERWNSKKKAAAI